MRLVRGTACMYLGSAHWSFHTTEGRGRECKSTALPVLLALGVPHILSQYHYLTNRLARYLLGLVHTVVRGNSWFVRVSLQSALCLSQCGQKVFCLYDSVTAKD